MTESMKLDRRSILVGALGGVVVGAAGGFFAGYAGLLEARTAAAERATPAAVPPPSASVPAPHGAPPKPDAGKTEFVNASFAQQGEDIIIANMLSHAGIFKPTYIDVGAHHPVVGSNTYLLYKMGGRGVLVEPNPTYGELLRQARPGDTVLEAGIGITDQREADYFVLSGDDGQLNTFSKERADAVVKNLGRRVEKVIKRQLLDVNAVLDKYFERPGPDLFSIDVEGLDFAILKTLDFERFRPLVLCVETAQLESGKPDPEIQRYLGSKGYAVRGGTLINTIFLDERPRRAPDGGK